MAPQLTIADRRAAAALANARTRAIVFELMRSDHTLSELRERLGISLSLLHYHLGRLQLLGLVVVPGTRARLGRASKIYRAAASEFLVPGGIATAVAGTGLRAELERALDDAGGLEAGDVRYFLDKLGTPRMQRMPVTGRGKAHERWWRLRLSAPAVAQLTREIAELIARYERAEESAAARHLCHFVVVESER